MEISKNSYGYARTSTHKQNIKDQTNALIEIGVLPGNIYEDEGVSGLTLAKYRKNFKKLYNLIENGEVDKLYIFELSRLGRSSSETLQLFIEIEQKGIPIISISPEESWTRLVDEQMKGIRNIFISMFAWFAEIEKKSLSERTKLGQDQARREGKTIGRPRKEPDRKEYDKHLKKGLKPAQVARIMQIPTSTMYKWIDVWDMEDRKKMNEGYSE